MAGLMDACVKVKISRLANGGTRTGFIGKESGL